MYSLLWHLTKLYLINSTHELVAIPQPLRAETCPLGSPLSLIQKHFTHAGVESVSSEEKQNKVRGALRYEYVVNNMKS